MSSSPDVILQEGGLVYSALSSDYQDVAYELVASCFVSEPISMHVEHDQNVRLRDALAFTKYFAEPCVTNGLSIMCTAEGSGELAGALYVRDYKASLPEGLDISQYSSICPAVSLVIELEHRYDALRAADITKEGQCVDHWMLAVSPNYQRRGIAERLVAAASTLAARRGYRYAVLESTGAFSAKCAQKCGMKPVFTQVYSELGGESSLQSMPPPHTSMTLWELELQPTI